MPDENIMAGKLETGRAKIVAAEIIGEDLIVTVEGSDVEAVTSAEARQVAYRERLKHGFASAGISADGGPYPIHQQSKDILDTRPKLDAAKGHIVYRCQYKLQRAPV